MNPTKDPILSPLLSGDWSLLYTAPLSGEFFLLYFLLSYVLFYAKEEVDKFAGTEEGPFLARLKPFSFGLVRQKGSSQVCVTCCDSMFSPESFCVDNRC